MVYTVIVGGLSPARRRLGSFCCIGAERGAPSDSSPLEMGAGSSKRVHPEAAFHAADTDKDGKLTLQELGAMLQAQGIAWSPKRIEGLLCAFDEDGDGALDLAEFVNSLAQLAAVAGAVLEKQQPSEPAVAAGVVAVGSRLDKNNYVEEMAAWARDPQQLLPKAVLLQANIAAVQAIGPAYLQAHLEQRQIDELTAAVEAVKDADIGPRTGVEHQLAEAKKRKTKTDAKLKEALDRIHAVMLASAEAISPGLARDGEKYTEALNQLVANATSPRPSSWPSRRLSCMRSTSTHCASTFTTMRRAYIRKKPSTRLWRASLRAASAFAAPSARKTQLSSTAILS